ncbi:hypothetical protein POM88_053306 [Heracleum sosnowskyi]|uniref:Uncharacterized protein n=1 Tax=Heracleum sosnowskyi TaxID=360622 RepID=A0AAD8LXN2_9APIA|nr:hypothetical protein POM88_053306 [Heracleum sosnowskyi]
MSSSSSLNQTPESSAENATNQSPILRPMDYDSEFETWAEPSSTNPMPARQRRKRKKIIVEESDYEDELLEELHATPSVVEDLADSEKTESINRGAPTAEGTQEDDEFTSPESSPEETLPFPLKPQDVDIDWSQHGPLSKREMDVARKNAGTFACVNMSSTIPERDIKKIMHFYSQEGSYAKPHPDMRPHRFDIDNITVPRAVVTDRHIPLGVGAPLHPWLRQIVDWYQIAPIQLSPNSYRMALGLFITHKELKYPDPTMLELSWFFSLQSNIPGYYFLVPWRDHMGKGINDGKVSNIKDWKERFFYLYNTIRQPIEFKIGVKHPKPSLVAPFSTQCSKILALLESGKKLNALVTFDNLKKYGFIPTLAGHPDSPHQGKTKKYKRKQVISDSEDEDMTGVPNLFGAPRNSSATQQRGSTITIPVSTKKHAARKNKNQDLNQDIQPPPKKQNIGKVGKNGTDAQVDEAGAPTSVAAPNCSSLRVFNAFVHLGDSLISENEYKRWMARSDSDKQKIATRASLDLFMFNSECEKNKEENVKRMKELEAEVGKLKADLARQVELAKKKDAFIRTLEEKTTDLELKLDELEEEKDSGWAAEKEKLSKESFDEGIKAYCITFLAGEPNYDWRPKFGTGMADFLVDISQKEAQAIAEKRIALEEVLSTEDVARQPGENANPEKSAPEDNVEHTSTDAPSSNHPGDQAT